MTKHCKGCGVVVADDAVQWYGKWALCGDCKARSVVTGWMPSDASMADRELLNRDVVELKAER